MATVRVETIEGVGVRVTFPEAAAVDNGPFFTDLLGQYRAEGATVSSAAAAAWAADVSFHADLVRSPSRLGLDAGNQVTVADRGVPLRVGMTFPAGMILPRTGARRADVPAAERAGYDPAAVPAGLTEQAAALERERRTYYLALASLVRACTYDVPAAEERAGGVVFGQFVTAGVVLAGKGAAPCFYALATRTDLEVSAATRRDRDVIVVAARDYVKRLATFNAGFLANGSAVMPTAGEVEQAAAGAVAAAATREWDTWRAAATTTTGGGSNTRAGAKSGMGTLGKVALGLWVVKTVLAD